jgi:hypothetical protein
MIAAVLIAAGLGAAEPASPYACGTPDETVALLYGELGEKILMVGVDDRDKAMVVVFVNPDTGTYSFVLHSAGADVGCRVNFGKIIPPEAPQ